MSKMDEKSLKPLDPEREIAMDRQIDIMAEKVKERDFEVPEGINIGIETEFPLIYKDLTQVTAEDRDQIIEDNENLQSEVGASMCEAAVGPLRDLKNVAQIHRSLELVEEDLKDELDQLDVSKLRLGTNPFVAPESIKKGNEEKYQLVPQKYDELRNEDVIDEFGRENTVDPRNSDIAGIICSTQLNLQVDELDTAVYLANIGYQVSPFVAAVSANSSFVDGDDLGFDDTRMQMWEISHDDRESFDEELGVGRIESYWDDYDDFVEGMKDRPHILNGEVMEDYALDIGEGMYWKDARIKAAEGEGVSDELLVEYRIPSTQPTPEEDAAIHAFYIGRILFEAESEGTMRDIEVPENMEEDLMDIEKVNRNRSAAMYNGLDTKMYSSNGDLIQADEAVRNELLKAEEGLRNAGIDGSEYLDVLYDRVDRMETPADELRDLYSEQLEKDITGENALYNAIKNQMDREVL